MVSLVDTPESRAISLDPARGMTYGSRQEDPARGPGSAITIQMSGQNLLIVENYEPVADVTAAALAEYFGTIAIAATLAEARRFCLASKAPFDMVICSQALPDGQGADFKRWLDELPDQRRSPFVLMAGSLPGLRRAQSNFVILSKPFMIEELLQAIEEAREMTAGPPPAGPPPA